MRLGEGEVSSQTKEVSYSKNDSVKTAVDYEANEAIISVLVEKDSSPEEVQKLVNSLPVEVLGENVDLSELKPTDQAVKFSLEKENAEKEFVIQQTQRQMNELDVQAERLINSNTGIPDSFIYQRAHNKKMALITQAQERIEAQSQLYERMRARYGIVVKRAEKSKVAESIKNNEEPEVKNKEVIVKQSQNIEVQPESIATNSQEEKASQRDVGAVAPETAKVEMEPVQGTVKPETSTVSSLVEKPKKVVSYKVQLPENSLKTRASKYAPLAEKESKNWEVDAALIMAIMHSESAFRADAKSHIPAFGLMQVVPTSAGHDVNKQVRNIDAPMKPSELYQPLINVETGTAYLDILNRKYLRKIENDESRLYCVIAAYNTGAGNVARAFNLDRSTNIGKASKIINSMSPEEVYEQLMVKLPYDETKGYLKKVSSRIALYK